MDKKDSLWLNTAIKIACEVHGDQLDLIGNPYIHHPLRVMNYLVQNNSSIETVIVGVLHDTLEDAEHGLKLRLNGYLDQLKYCIKLTDEMTEALLLVTRYTEFYDGEFNFTKNYDEYILNIKNSSNQIAKDVKKADLLDNLNVNRLALLNYNLAIKLSSKYLTALKILQG